MNITNICKDCLLHNKKVHDCPFCHIDFNNQNSVITAMRTRHKSPTANTVIRNHKRGIEILHFTEDFSVKGNKKSCDRSRKFYYDELDSLRKKNPFDPNCTWNDLFICKQKNRKRALDCFLNYGQNNDWDYFFTITLNPKKLDSTNQNIVKYAWKKFRQRLQYYFPNIKLLTVIEYPNDNNKLHFHGLIGNASISSILVRATNSNPKSKHYLKPLETVIGDKVYNFSNDIFSDGFCSIVKLVDRTSDLTVYEKIVFYLAKYMSKERSAVPYCGKSYFHTRNLDKGTKEVIYLSDDDFFEFLSCYSDLIHKKTTDKFTSFYTRNLQVNLSSPPPKTTDDIDPIFLD